MDEGPLENLDPSGSITILYQQWRKDIPRR